MKINKRKLFGFFLSAVTILLVYNCASPGSIKGGPRDEDPPRVDSAASTPTPLLNFDRDEIIISFNEWVQLEDAFQQIFISPPLQERPEYKLKKRSLVIEFHENEELQPNTTYIINLGKSVVDLTESNPIEDFQYVFSTGDILDSLYFEGQIIDVITGEPAENVSVMLFDNLSDTAITTVSPSYYARTNENGYYKFNYMRADTFQLVGFIDENQDFSYDQENEPIGFLNEPIRTDQVSGSKIDFSISLGPPPVYLDDVDTTLPGLINLVFTENIIDTASMHIKASSHIGIDRIKNTMRIWYDTDSLPVEVITENIRGLKDTVIVQSVSKDLPETEYFTLQQKNISMVPGEPMRLQSNWPINTIETGLIEIEEGASKKTISLDSAQLTFTEVSFHYRWKGDSTYNIKLLPGALNFKGDIPNDTITYKIKPIPLQNLSSLELSFTKDSSYTKVPQLILQLKQGENVVESKTITDLDQPFTFNRLKPGEYSLTIIKDANGNGIWDPARYYEKKQAEGIQNIDIGTLRVNWIQETEIILK